MNFNPPFNMDFICRILSFIFILSLVTHCKKKDPSVSATKVTMGIPTSSVEAVVQLTLTNNGQVAYCTGTFISDSVVLTAAHCFDTVGDEKVQVHRRKLAFQWDSGLFRGGKLTA